MAASKSVSLSIPVLAPVIPINRARGNRPRRIGREAGHALEILGHAIEYLTDEYVHEGGTFTAHNPQLEAIQLLMELNREVHSECPEALSFVELCRSFLHFHRH